MTLKSIVDWLIEHSRSSSARVTLATAGNMARIARGEKGNFAIFDNAGGNAFDIWKGREIVETLVIKHRGWVYAYRLDGIDFVLKEPARIQGHFIGWEFVA